MNTQRASRKNHHIVYKTMCLVTNRYYIGMHSTDNLNDDYLGSGRRIRASIKKHGKKSHARIILEEHSTRDAASKRESEIITPALRADPLCLNCGAGGLGATDRSATKEETRKLLSEKNVLRWQVEGRREKQAAKIREWHQNLANSAIVGEASKIAWAQNPDRRLTHGDKCRQTAIATGSSVTRQKSCTIDSITIYSGIRELVKALGQGKNGSRNPNLRYV